jgi:hypothetical protein
MGHKLTCNLEKKLFANFEYTPPEGILADLTWGRKYEKGGENREENVKKKGDKTKDREEFELNG